MIIPGGELPDLGDVMEVIEAVQEKEENPGPKDPCPVPPNSPVASTSAAMFSSPTRPPTTEDVLKKIRKPLAVMSVPSAESLLMDMRKPSAPAARDLPKVTTSAAASSPSPPPDAESLIKQIREPVASTSAMAFSPPCIPSRKSLLRGVKAPSGILPKGRLVRETKT
jgi:hypothetical protein